ncbi:MAG: hypothetical protein ACYC2U_07225 [Candidatus Amoebophilus sp.]
MSSSGRESPPRPTSSPCLHDAGGTGTGSTCQQGSVGWCPEASAPPKQPAPVVDTGMQRAADLQATVCLPHPHPRTCRQDKMVSHF